MSGFKEFYERKEWWVRLMFALSGFGMGSILFLLFRCFL